MQLKWIIWPLLSLLAATGLMLAMGHISLWYLWERTPDDTIKVGINQDQPAAGHLTSYITPHLPPEVVEAVGSSRRFVYTRGNGQTLAIVPGNPFSMNEHKRIAAILRRHQWRVNRTGLVIEGTSNATLLDRPGAARRAIARMADGVVPIQPLLIAAASQQHSIPALPDTGAAIASVSSDSRAMTLLVGKTLADLAPSSDQFREPQVQELKVAVQSTVLSLLESDILDEMNTKIVQELGFSATNPDIIDEIVRHKAVAVSSVGEEAAVAIWGDQSHFVSTARTWLQEEEAAGRVEQRAFRLPDGTLGYEIAPGKLQPVLSVTIDSDGCRQPLLDRTALWLCHSGQAAALGTSKRAALDQLQQASAATWSASVGSAFFAALPTKITALSAGGDSSLAVITLFLE